MPLTPEEMKFPLSDKVIKIVKQKFPFSEDSDYIFIKLLDFSNITIEESQQFIEKIYINDSNNLHLIMYAIQGFARYHTMKETKQLVNKTMPFNVKVMYLEGIALGRLTFADYNINETMFLLMEEASIIFDKDEFEINYVHNFIISTALMSYIINSKASLKNILDMIYKYETQLTMNDIAELSLKFCCFHNSLDKLKEYLVSGNKLHATSKYFITTIFFYIDQITYNDFINLLESSPNSIFLLVFIYANLSNDKVLDMLLNSDNPTVIRTLDDIYNSGLDIFHLIGQFVMIVGTPDMQEKFQFVVSDTMQSLSDELYFFKTYLLNTIELDITYLDINKILNSDLFNHWQKMEFVDGIAYSLMQMALYHDDLYHDYYFLMQMKSYKDKDVVRKALGQKMELNQRNVIKFITHEDLQYESAKLIINNLIRIIDHKISIMSYGPLDVMEPLIKAPTGFSIAVEKQSTCGDIQNLKDLKNSLLDMRKYIFSSDKTYLLSPWDYLIEENTFPSFFSYMLSSPQDQSPTIQHMEYDQNTGYTHARNMGYEIMLEGEYETEGEELELGGKEKSNIMQH